MLQRTVRDLMRIRHGLVVTETSTLREVAERLIISDCDLMVVTDQCGKLAGIVCESSIVRALLGKPATDATEKDESSKDSCKGDLCLTCVLFKVVVSFCVDVVLIPARGC